MNVPQDKDFSKVGIARKLRDTYILSCAKAGVCPECYQPFNGYHKGEKCQCGFPQDYGDEE